MSEWFDRTEGVLIFGEAAYNERLEQGFSSDIVSIASIVSGDEPMLFEGDVTPVYEKRRQSNDDVRSYGKWLLSLLRQEDPEVVLRTDHVERAHKLGLGLVEDAITHRFGSFYAFRDQVDKPYFGPRHSYDQWTLENYVQYASRLSKALGGRKPKFEDYLRWGRENKGPGIGVIKRAVKGGVSRLNDQIGFPDIRSYERDDYIAWGIRVARVNEGRRLGLLEINTLASRHRGPGANTILGVFGGIGVFADEVKSHHEHEAINRLERHETLLDEFAGLEEEILEHISATGWSSDQKVEFMARFKLAADCSKGLTLQQLVNLACVQNSTSFVRALQRQSPRLSAGHIETAAEALGVFDDVWDLYSKDHEYFRIDEAEIDQLRQLRYAKRTAHERASRERSEASLHQVLPGE